MPTRRWLLWLGLLALAGYGGFLATKTTAIAGGSDSSGYLNCARLLVSGELQPPLRLPPELQPPVRVDAEDFVPLGFVPAQREGHMTPAYPTGLPLQFAAFAAVLGWDAGPWWFVLLSAVATVWLCYLTARELGLGVWLAWAGAVTLAVYPQYLFSSIQALSDAPATTWCLAALYFGLRARRAPNWAIATGLAFSIAVLVRPTNLLLAPALLVLLGLDWRRLARFVISGIPAAVWLLWYNQHQYGSPFRTGYGDVSAAFSVIYGWPTFLHFTKWLALLLPAILLVLPFAALAHRATRNRELLALALAFAAITGLYLFYDCSHDDWWWLRFILPGVPALLLMGLLGIEAIARGPAARWPRAFRAGAAMVIAGWAIGTSLYWTPRLHVFLVEQYESRYADASLLARDTLPPGSLVAAQHFSGALYYYTDLHVLNAFMVEPSAFARYVELARNAGRPVYAVLFEFEAEEAFSQRCPGQWKRVGGVGNVGFWQLE